MTNTTISFRLLGVLLGLLQIDLSIAQVEHWNIVMDFENTRGDATRTGQVVQGDCDVHANIYEFTTDAGATIYNNVSGEVYGFGQSLKTTVEAGSTGFGSFGGILELSQCGMRRLQESDEVWIRFRMKFPLDFAYLPSGRLKWIRLRTRNSSDGGDEGYLDMYLNSPLGPVDSDLPFHFIAEFDAHWDFIGAKNGYATLGLWETYEIYYRLHSQPGDQLPGAGGVVRMWKNGHLIVELTDRKTLNTPQSYIDEIYFFTWFTNQGSPKTQSVFLDDIRITNTRPELNVGGTWQIGVGAATPKPPVVIQ